MGTPIASETVDAVADAVAARVTADPPLVRRFVRRFLAETDPADLRQRGTDDLAAAIALHWRTGEVVGPGSMPVTVSRLEGDDGSFAVVCSVVEDMAFLVDSILGVITRRDVAIRLTVHPMIEVRRDGSGRIADIDDHRGVVEAWTMVVVDDVGDEELSALESEISAVLADVRRVSADREAIRQLAIQLAADIGMRRSAPAERAAEFLTWLTRQRFIFLGAARYVPDGDGLAVVPGSGLGLLRAEHEPDPPRLDGPEPLTVVRTDARSTVHRPRRMTCVVVRSFDADGTLATEHRLIGLLAAAAYRESAAGTPLLREKVDSVLDRAGFPSESHAGRALQAAIESIPRDELFEIDASDLFELTMGIVGLQERHMVRIFAVPDPANRYVRCLVYFPRTRFTPTSAASIAELLRDAFAGTEVDFDTTVGASALARVDVLVRRGAERAEPDIAALEADVDRLTTDWIELVAAELAEAVGKPAATEVLARLAGGVPIAYRASVSPADAVGELLAIGALEAPGDLSTALRPEPDGEPGDLRFALYRRGGEPSTLSAVLPYLEHLGVEVLDQRPFEFVVGDPDSADDVVWVSQIGIRLPAGIVLDDARATQFRRSFVGLLRQQIESDGFNRLVVTAGLTVAQVAVLRAYAKYTRQVGFPYSQTAIESMLARWPDVARGLVALFEERFDPGRASGDSAERAARLDALETELGAALDAIPSLDDDRIGRELRALVDATLRTNAFRRTDHGGPRDVLAFKFDPGKVPDLPQPRPMFEIFVCSPRVEGVHLRGGRIARGGLRWSDRREDFRTEVLGLMKAQMVKNAVIIPVGAKGGFVVKRLPADPEGQRAEVVACYTMFVAALLDVTDNLVDGVVVPPPDTVRYDGDDPYLVVAADKGTATFSDVANSVAADYGFWLGDAFASGGSEGYDHKEMGITARGAWESVRRHAQVFGKDADRDRLTVVGIGDMSGDVFGNGMLRSPHIALVAAFDHRHVFIDPDPDPQVAYAERRRLFELPRSSWADYDASLISAGGGVYARTLKVVELSDEARRALGINASHVTPNELISHVLRAPVDLLWNGGIGTYVKASSERHADVGDRANDAVRVDALELRCRMVGEGGNLGFTQRARVEYALRGGLINTDAIDNSAGVDCSDHEVNIKILLHAALAAGRIDLAERNRLLHSMTEEVAELVLADNRAQTRTLGIARLQAAAMINVHTRYLDQLALEGWLNRDVEDFPSDKMLAERQAAGLGFTVPELAVMLAYTKTANIAEIGETSLPDDPYFVPDLVAYFPHALRDRFRTEIENHQLRREIVITSLVNQMVNHSGTSFDHRMTEETGASSSDVLRAWVAARDIFGLPELWERIESLTASVGHDAQVSMFFDARRMIERSAMWLLRHRRPPLDIAAVVEEFAVPVRALLEDLGPLVRGPLGEQIVAVAGERIVAGVPEPLAWQSANWSLMHTAFDTVELASACGKSAQEAAGTYWQLFDGLDLTWLWNAIGSLPRVDRWQTHARAALRDELLAVIVELVADVIDHGGNVAEWCALNRRAVERMGAMFTEIRRIGQLDLAALTVALRQLRNLALSTTAPVR